MTSSFSERLAFNFGTGSVPSRRDIDAALAADARTFATSPFAEPRDWGYAGLLVFTAVLLLRPQDQLAPLRPLHLAEVSALIGIGPMMLHRFTRRLPVFCMTPETVLLFGFASVIALTAPFSIWPGGVVEVMIDYLKIVVVFVLMLNTLTTPKRVEQLTWLILVALGYLAFRAALDYARGVNLVEDGRVRGAVSGIFGNPNDLALNMVTFLPVALMVALTRRHSFLRRSTAAVIAALMLATVVFTRSRGGALGLGSVLVALIFLGRKIRPGFAVAAIGAVLAAVPLMPSSFWARMETIVNEKADATNYTGSREARRIVMQEGIDAFMAYPLTGVGAGQFKNYNPPERRERWRETHNALIQVASELGIVGLTLFSLLIVRGALAAAQTRRLLARPRRATDPDPLSRVMREDDRRALYAYTAALSAGLIGWFTCSLFASVAYNWTFYYLLALIVATRELTRVRLAAAQALDATPPRHGAARSAASRPAVGLA